MTDSQRDRRLGDASSLQKSLASLHKVPHEERLEFFHDRIMSAIDDVCARHKGTKATGHFTNSQIAVIKDVIFQAVFIVEPMNRPQTGFVNKILSEWRETSAMKQVTIVLGVCGFMGTFIAGAYHEGAAAFKFVKGISITQKNDDGNDPAKAVKPPPSAAGSPSTSSTSAPQVLPPRPQGIERR